MWSFTSGRRARRKAMLGAGAATAAALAVTASLAFGQAGPKPDGGPPEAAANTIVTNCGPNLSSRVVTRNSPSTMSTVAFQTLPGATVQEIVVPAGTSRCIKVLFTAETACGLTAAPDFCYVQATLNAAPMDPNGAGFQAIDSEDGTASAHAYEWIKRVGPGVYNVAVQRRVLVAGTPFYTDDWTLDVQTFQ